MIGMTCLHPFISMITYVLVFLSTIAGIIVQYFLPEHHLSEDSKIITKPP
jgi:hypothetical protein